MIRRASLDDVRIASILIRQSTLRHWIDAKWSYTLIILIVAVGAVIGIIVIVTYLPIFSFGTEMMQNT